MGQNPSTHRWRTYANQTYMAAAAWLRIFVAWKRSRADDPLSREEIEESFFWQTTSLAETIVTLSEEMAAASDKGNKEKGE